MKKKASHTPEASREQFGLATVDENEWICVGAFTGAHGVRGDVRLKSFTEDPEELLTFNSIHRGPGGPIVEFKAKKHIKGGYAVAVEGVADCNAAEAQQGVQLYVSREEFSDLDDDEFYLADLIGIEAVDIDAEPVGLIRAVENFGADDLLEIALYTPVKGIGKLAMIPFRKEWVPQLDLQAGRAVVAFQEWVDTQVEVPTDSSKAEAEEKRNTSKG
ncbi:ribosome maturation factor RimM [Temperatibacter marinus]|uniref:Ribosome maturation factor RimM n=1 Tax=Temperatibacter marinus TaxID=1456591 RepID=A0AA52EGD6_9PROT|nr:ribosome maturation factor RimM [Temperatibacter marinus]WND01829.1 ribosome maturation factor RimM [Temperatibacter marinus]